MKVRVAGEVWRGRAIDLRELDCRKFDIDAGTVAEAIRGRTVDGLVIDCPDTRPVHRHVGVLTSSTTASRRVVLAAAARSRGYTAPQADELAELLERLAELESSAAERHDGRDLLRARERVADASDVEAGLRERVAALRGRVQALRETADPERAETDLAEATRRLSEVETERIAAEQALAHAREQARAIRETRRERLRLQDRAGNLRRAAREYLSARVSDDFEKAREAIPDDADLAESVETALAVARVADLDAPVVLASGVGPFESVADAARWLDAAVVRV